jgi:hypothetical protein
MLNEKSTLAFDYDSAQQIIQFFKQFEIISFLA